MYRAVHDPTAPTVEKLDLSLFVQVPTVVVDIPKGAYGEITASDVEQILGSDPD
jgi:hypothetical protein